MGINQIMSTMYDKAIPSQGSLARDPCPGQDQLVTGQGGGVAKAP